VLDPDALAARIDKDRDDEGQPDDPAVTSGQIFSNCNPQICTLEFRDRMEALHNELLAAAPHGAIGLCVSGSAFLGMQWGGEVCAYYKPDNHADFVTVSGKRGWGYDLSGGVSMSTVDTPNMQDLCGHSNYADLGVGPFTVGRQRQ
jgi:hypothetical protein